MARRRRRNRMPAGLRRYHARRRRHSNPHRMHARTRTIVRYRSRRRRSNTRRRYRNPSFSGFNTRDLMYMGGGALVNGIISRSGPQMLLSSYNTGIAGYALNVAFGAAGAWGIGKFNRRAGQGAWIGMIVALGQRVIADHFGSGSAGASAGMSGDLDFDLGYYASDPYPFPQGSAAGPYARFPGTPYMAVSQIPVTRASAVQAGKAAAAAALTAAAPAAAGATPDVWGSAWS